MAQVVTFRLADSLPKALYDEIARDPERASRRRRFNDALDGGRGGCALQEPETAAFTAQALKHFDGERYRLFAWVVMPNHVHVLFEPNGVRRLGEIVECWKSFTARAINRRQGRSGRFWAPDYYDRYVRDEGHFASALRYIEDNPVNSGLVWRAEEWLHSSAHREQVSTDAPADRGRPRPPPRLAP